ncbi:MAG: hypothetical protein ACNYZH_09595, partial [Acidimicrobiia bacterium]
MRRVVPPIISNEGLPHRIAITRIRRGDPLGSSQPGRAGVVDDVAAHQVPEIVLIRILLDVICFDNGAAGCLLVSCSATGRSTLFSLLPAD